MSGADWRGRYDEPMWMDAERAAAREAAIEGGSEYTPAHWIGQPWWRSTPDEWDGE